MTKIYTSWSNGVPQSKEALKILRENNLGLEMTNIDDLVEMVQDAGVKFCSHTPGLQLTLNLASPDFIPNFTENKKGPRLLEVIKKSDAPAVGFHLGYSAKKVFKMRNYPNIPTPETIIGDKDKLLEIISANLNNLTNIFKERGINQQILIEALDYTREKLIRWELEPEDGEAAANKELIEKVVKQYGTNAGILCVTETNFIRDVLEKCKDIGFLLDTCHTLISAETKIHKKEFRGTIEEYFQSMIDVIKNRIKQLHLSVPNDDGDNGYSHFHNQFTPGNYLSDLVMNLTKMIYEQTKENIQVITLEIETGLEPVEHVKKMVQQTKYVIKELGISLT